MKNKVYKSKDDIYLDYDLAIKFGANHGEFHFVHDNVVSFLEEKYDLRFKLFHKNVAPLGGDFSAGEGLAVGYYVEETIKANSGKVVGVNYVFLTHETGPELFLEVDSDVANFVFGYLGGKLIDYLSKSYLRLLEKWGEKREFEKKCEIEYVEFRSQHKGVARLMYDDFSVNQIACIMKKWNNLSKLIDADKDCFQGKAFLPK